MELTSPRSARLCSPLASQSPPSAMVIVALSTRAASPRGDSAVQSAVRSVAQAVHLQNVVRRADQRPFTLDLRQPTQEELAKAPRLLDLPDHWFHDCLPRGIDDCARLRVQLARHPIGARRGRRQGAARTGPRSLAMALLPGRDVRSMGVAAIEAKFSSEQ